MAKAMQPQKMRFSQAIQTPMYKNLVNNTLGDPARGARFIANITSAVAVNPALQECNPGTILAGALLGESLLLQPSPQLGQFYLVPFKSKAKRDRQGNVIEPASVKAQFVLGYKGYIQLALRTGQYKRLNVLEVKAGELSGWDPFEERFHEMHFMFLLDSGAFTFMHGVEASSKPVDWDGYLSRYIGFINRHNVQHFFELDVDIIVGYDAVKRMRARLEAETGKQSIPVWHRSRGLDEFKSLCRDYPYIGIGGFAIKHIQPSEYGYIKRLVQYANACGVRVHGLGYTKKDAVDFGFYSVDSTTWTTQVNFGGLSYFNGSEMVVVRPPKGMIGADYRIRREYALKEWIKYQKYLDTKGKWRG